MLDAIEISTGERPERAVIWLHGLGADGHDFEPIVPQLGLRQPVRFVFPHAPVMPVTINTGHRMRAWYDLAQLGPGPEDAVGIRASAELVRALLDRELARGVASDRIVLAGFSQGGAIALHLGLREPRRLAGILALSTYLPLAETLARERSTANAEVPIWMAHGSEDPVIDIGVGERSRAALESLGYSVDWHAYRMAHGVSADEVADIGRWLAGL